MKTYVLDTTALICLIGGEAGATRVAQILKQAELGHCRVLMSAVNWGEFVYKIWASRGEAKLTKLLADMDRLRLEVEHVERVDAFGSARIKTLHHVPYADAFAAALAVRERAVLVTSDSHFERLGKQLPILWLR